MPRFTRRNESVALSSRSFGVGKDPAPGAWPDPRTRQRKPKWRDQARVRENSERPYFGLVEITRCLRGMTCHVRRNEGGDHAIPAAGPARPASAAINLHGVSRA